MTQTQDTEILLGVTGGIAAYKSADLCSRLVRQGYGVTVVMTENATRFVTPLTFGSLSGRKVYTSMWDSQSVYDTRHIALAGQAHLIVVAPATANIIAKAAQGICDDLLSTILCGRKTDLLMAPAMNTQMWQNAATQRNIEFLVSRGVHLVGPSDGNLACGEIGPGRMSEPDEIIQRIKTLTGGTIV